MGVPDVSTLAVVVKSSGISETSSQLSGLGTSAKNAETKVVSLTASIDKLMNVQRTATGAAMAYAQSLQGAQQYLGGNQASTLGLETATAMLAKSMSSLSTSLQTVKEKSVQSRAAIQSHTVAMQDAHAAARGLSGGMGALWLTYGNIAPMVAGVAVAAGMKAIVSIGKDVENTLEGIRVKGQETVESVANLREVIMSLGTGIYGPREVAKALETLILAGLNAKEAALGINAALNLATVGGTSIEKAAYSLVQVGTALGYSAAGYDRIADVIAMTAAASMSSVDSVSESFKAGSVLGKLYGVTLSDIGVQFALLSNLGIKGTAAGTSAKNFYSVLLGDSKKTAEALKSIHLSVQDFKDSEGNVKPLVEVFSLLNEGLSKYTKVSQDVFIANASNERGRKLMVEGLDAIRTAGETTATKMEDVFKKIDESYGFAAQGAAAMALTVDSQFKSVKNTLETQFLKAFEDIQPQIAVVARALKDAFNSPEFVKGIQSVALAIADLTVFIIDNVAAGKVLLEGFLAWKAISFIVGTLVAVAEGLVAVEKALAAGRIAAIAFQASLGLIGVALLAAGAAFLYWKTQKEDAMGSAATRADLTYLDDFNKKLDDENTRLEGQIKLLAEGKTKREADTQAMIDQQVQLINLKRLNAGSDERTSLSKMESNLSGGDLKAYQEAKARGLTKVVAGGREVPNLSDGDRVDSINAVLKAQQNLNEVEKQANDLHEKSIKALEKNIVLNKASSALADKAAKEGRLGNSGDETLPPKLDKGAISDRYSAALAKIQGDIDSVNRELKSSLADLDSAYKQGLIGDIALIDLRREASVKAHQEDIKLLQDKLRLSAPDKKESVRQEIENDKRKYLDKTIEDEAEATRKIAELYASMEEKKKQASIAGLKASGQYVEAFLAEQGVMYDAELSRNNSNLATLSKHLAEQMEIINDSSSKPAAIKAATEEAERLEERLGKSVEYFQFIMKSKKEGEASAAFKQSDFAVQATLRTLEENVAAFKARQTDGSILSNLFGMSVLQKQLKDGLPVALKELQDSEAKMNESTADSDKKAYETRKIEYDKLLKEERDIYKQYIDDIDKIGMETFRGFFDKTSGGWEATVKKMKDSFKTMLIDEIYKMLVRPFVLNILANVTGAAGATGLSQALSAAAGSGGDGGGLFGNVAGMASNAMSLFGAGSAIATGAGALPGTLLASNAVGALGGDSLGSLIALNPQWTAGAFSEGAAAASAGTEAIFAGASQSAAAEMGGSLVAGSAEGAGLAAEAPALTSMGPVGWTALAVLAAVAIFGGGMFGGGGDSPHNNADESGFGLTLSKAGTAGMNDAGYADRDTGFNGIGPYSMIGGSSGGGRWGDLTDLPASTVAAINSQIAVMFSAGHASAKMLGVDPTVIDTASVSNYKFPTIAAALSQLGDAIALKLIPNLTSFATGTETLSQTFTRVITQYGQIAMVFTKINLSNLSLSLVELGGGFDTLKQSLEAYYTAYFSQAEQQANAWKDMSTVFAVIGMVMPTTRAGFRSLVESLDLTTDYGKNAFTALMKVSGSFATLSAATDQAQASLEAYKQSLLASSSLSANSPSGQYDAAKANFQNVLAKSNAGDSTATGQLQTVIDAFLTTSKAVSTQDAYATDFSQAIAATGGTWTGPKFAAGGTHKGGFRMVGENGPEVEYTGPSQIINNQNAKAMFDNSDMVAEIASLRNDLRAANTAIAQNTNRQARLLERWDGDGMPAVRTV